MRKLILMFMLLGSAACSQKKSRSTEKVFLPGKKLVEHTNKKLDEASGLAASANNPGYLWTINDSGNSNEVFLIDQGMNIALTCRLEGLVNRDWEDIAVGPGPEPGKQYIYVADIGDNMAIFQYKYIYRFEEPSMTGSAAEVAIADYETIVFQLEDGKKDTESLLVDPRTKNLYVVSKREEPVHLYELPYPQSVVDTLIAESILSLPFYQIVGADFSADGSEILMKNYDDVFYWKLGNDSLKVALSREPAIVDYEKEPQGESITFARDGSGFFTTSEINKGKKSYLFFYPRK